MKSLRQIMEEALADSTEIDFSGREKEVRKVLPSVDFNWKVDKNKIDLDVKIDMESLNPKFKNARFKNYRLITRNSGKKNNLYSFSLELVADSNLTGDTVTMHDFGYYEYDVKSKKWFYYKR